MTKKAAIAIDAWKLPIFSRNLVAKGYHYTEGPGLTPGTLFLYVHTDNMQALAETYAREPRFYSGTFCVKCRDHFPVGPDGEFTWDGTTEKVGT